MYQSLAQQAVSTSTIENEWIVTAKHNYCLCRSALKLLDGSYVHMYEDVDVDERGHKTVFVAYHLMTAQQYNDFEEDNDFEDFKVEDDYEPLVMEEDWSIMTAKIVKRVDLCGIISWEEIWDLSYCKNVQWMKEELARFQAEYPHQAVKLVVEYA